MFNRFLCVIHSLFTLVVTKSTICHGSCITYMHTANVELSKHTADIAVQEMLSHHVHSQNTHSSLLARNCIAPCWVASSSMMYDIQGSMAKWPAMSTHRKKSNLESHICSLKWQL